MPLPAMSTNGSRATAVQARRSHRAQPKRATRTRRRWPIVTTSLVVLLVVIIGGVYGAWRWTQDQYYVAADSKGNVVIYRGITERILGFSLSKTYQQTGIPLTQVPSNYEQTVKATITASSLGEAQRIVNNVRTAVGQCHDQYVALATWVVQEDTYQAKVTLTQKQHKPTKNIVKPGPKPDNAGAMCPSSTAFGIPASALVPAAGHS